MVQMVAPAVSVCPISAARPVTVPALCAVERLLHLHGFEHDDEVARLDPLALFDGDLDDRSLHRAGQGVAGGSACALALGRPPRGRLACRGERSTPMPRPAGSTTSSRLPPTSTVTVSRSPARHLGVGPPPANGAMVLSNSVSIQRV